MKKNQFLWILLLILTLCGCQRSETKIIDEMISGFNLPASVGSSINLPDKLSQDEYEIAIVWTSSLPLVMDINGNVFRSHEDVEVTLTAQFTIGSIIKEKTYIIMVLALDSDTIVIRTHFHPGEISKIYYTQASSTFPELEIPTHQTATFLEWCLDADLEITIPSSMSLVKNIDLYAKWEVEFYDVQLNYTGFKNFTTHQFVHLQQLNILESFVERPEDTTIVSIDYLASEGKKFNLHKVKQFLYIDTIEKQYSIIYYKNQSEPVEFEHTYVEQYDIYSVNQYGITADHHIFHIVQNGIETQYIDLGLIDLQKDETIVEIVTGYNSVYVGTSHNKIHVISYLFNRGGYQDAGIVTFDLNLYNLGNFIKFYVSIHQNYAVIGVCEQGIIDLIDPYSFPYIFRIDDEKDLIKKVLVVQQDYYILTEKNQVYLARNWFMSPSNAYGNITQQLSLDEDEYLIDFLIMNLYVYFITSKARAIHYATYVSSQIDQTAYGIQNIYDFGIDINEKIEWVQGGIICTDAHIVYSVLLESGLSSPSIKGVVTLDLPLLQDEYVIDYFQNNIHEQHNPTMFITNLNQIIVYNRFNREYQRIENITLANDESILFYFLGIEEAGLFRILTTNTLYVGYNYVVDRTITQSVMDELGVTELFDLIIYEEYYSAFTYDGKQYLRYDIFTIETSHFSIWKITDHLILSKNDTIPQPDDADPLVHKTWSLSPGSLTTVPHTVTHDLNLYLFEDPYAYRLYFETATEQVFPSMKVERNSSYQLPVPMQSGKYFMGWYLDSSLTNMYHPDKTKLGNNYTLYAAWTNDTYHIYYNNVDDLILPTEMQTGTKPVITSEIPVKTGYQFLGWYDENNVRYQNDQPLFEDLHLYARFSAIRLQIKLIDEDDNIYHAIADYNQTLLDIQDRIYGYRISEFYLNHERNQVLDLDYILLNDQTLYMNLEPKDVSIILLEELVTYGEVNYFFINDTLFVEYNSQMYMYMYAKQQEHNGEPFYIDQPVNVTELLDLNREQITGVVSLGKYVLFIINNDEVRIIDYVTTQNIKTLNLNFVEGETLDLESLITLRMIQDDFYYFIGLSSKQKLYMFDLNGNITIVEGVTDLIQSTRFFIAVVNNIPIAYHFNNDGLVTTKNLYQEVMDKPSVKPILRIASGLYYKEVYENGRIIVFEYRRIDGVYNFITRNEWLDLKDDETIILTKEKMCFTSEGRVLSFANSTHLHIIDLKDVLINDEVILKVDYIIGSNYVVLTSNNRVIFTNGIQDILDLKNDEHFITVIESNIITNKRVYHFDWLSKQWLIVDVFLDGETLVQIKGNLGLTSLNRALYFSYILGEEPFLLTFKQYQIKAIMTAPFNSVPLLPDYGVNGFIGWYHESRFLVPFEVVNSSYPIVLYPKFE